MDRKQWWGIQISKGDYSQRITKAMERYLCGKNIAFGDRTRIFFVREYELHYFNFFASIANIIG